MADKLVQVNVSTILNDIVSNCFSAQFDHGDLTERIVHRLQLGLIKEGAYAAFILTRDAPSEDASILGNKDNILVVWKDGKVLKNIT